MNYKRQAHGLCKIGNFIYACGGIDSEQSILDSCERYDLVNKRWINDVPSLNNRKFSMTMIVI